MPAPDASAGLQQWLSWQESLHSRPIELGLGRVRSVATRLHLPYAVPTLTVAGTNGKGSSATLLGGIHHAAGRRVGVYTSPHLLRYNERIVIDGTPVDDALLCAAFAAIERERQTVPLTYFEFGTLAALWIFRELCVQLQVLEVGLGGRLDAVNLVDGDGLLITAIGLDHQDWLGHGREAIGREKAGILRARRPAVYVDAEPVASVLQHARDLGVPLHLLDRDFSIQPVADAWNWHGTQRIYKKLPPPALTGAHQLRNAAGVIALIEQMQEKLPVGESAIRTGLMRLKLPGRFERIGDTLLDVAHNTEAVATLCAQLKRLGIRDLSLVLGMLSDKPVEQVASLLAPHVDVAYLASLPGPRGLSATALASRCGKIFRQCVVSDTVATAYNAARELSGAGQLVLVCGSFLTVATVKELIDG